MGRLITTWLILAIITLMGGCGVPDALKDVATRLEGIGTDLANGTADFNATAGALTNELKNLPADAANEFRIAIEQAAGRTTQAAGIEARCTADFARSRLGADIKHIAATIRAKITSQPTPERPPSTPAVCQPVPATVRRDCDSRIIESQIVWDGYDLDDPSRLTLVLTGSGPPQAITNALSKSSPYQLVADLTRIPPTSDSRFTKITLKHGNTVLSEIPMGAKPPPRRETQTVQLDPWGPKVAARCQNPQNRSADTEFKGHGPRVTWSVRLSVENEQRLIATIKYEAMEWDEGKNQPRSDFTQACGEWREVVYTAPAGQRILRIVDDAKDDGRYVDDDNADDQASGSLYPRYVLGGDGDGDDVGRFTKIQAPVKGNVQIELELPCR